MVIRKYKTRFYTLDEAQLEEVDLSTNRGGNERGPKTTGDGCKPIACARLRMFQFYGSMMSAFADVRNPRAMLASEILILALVS